MRYAVTAMFDRPVGGRVCRSSEDDPADKVYADKGLESAARIWLWRLSPAERAATVRLLVGGLEVGYRCYPIYRGPAAEFVRVGGRLEALDG